MTDTDLRALSDAATPDEEWPFVRLVAESLYGATQGTYVSMTFTDALSIAGRMVRGDRGPALAASPSPATDREPRVLPAGTICACFDETGGRTTIRFDQCQRCGAFMDAEDVPSPATAFEAEMAENREHMASDFGEGRSDGERLDRRETCQHDGIEDASDCPRAGA